MVSNITFFSIKRLKIKETHVFVRLILGGGVALIWYQPAIALLLITSFYCLSGPFGLLADRFRKEG